jgi:hypothetical protein
MPLVQSSGIIMPLVQSSGIIIPLVQSSGIIDVNSGWRISAANSMSTLKSSAFKLSCPGDFPFFKAFIAVAISCLDKHKKQQKKGEHGKIYKITRQI